MTTIRQSDLIESISAALQYISYYHPADYISHLAGAYEAEQSPAAKDAIAQIEKRTPGGRLATTDDVVGSVDFLFTNKGVNGINLVIDGGWLLT
jgi:NAD(P)-dependent dehydrogenase (short-subunit alcohol dehydrogenase family)